MDLPPNWTRYTTDDGKEYYHNSVTNVTQWDKPVWQPPAGGKASTTTDAVYNPSLDELMWYG